MPEVTGQVDGHDMPILLGQCREMLPSRVFRAVVHQHQFVVVAGDVFAHDRETAMQLADATLLVAAGNHHRQSQPHHRFPRIMPIALLIRAANGNNGRMGKSHGGSGPSAGLGAV